MSNKRHDALQNLSSDHHLFLIEVRKIRRLVEGNEVEGTSRENIAKVLAFWTDHLEPHLREEEEVVYPLYLQYIPAAGKDIAALQIDHDWMREKFEELAQMPHYENCMPLLRSIGKYILSHIRHEEQFIYEHIQQKLDQSALQEIAQQTSIFRSLYRAGFAGDPALPDTDMLNFDWDAD